MVEHHINAGRSGLAIQNQIIDMFRQWLGSDEAITYLETCAARTLENPSFASIPELGLLTDFKDSGSVSSAEELAQEIIVFILDSCLADIQSRPEEMNFLMQGQFQVFISHSVTRYCNYIKDRARGRDRDPVRYLYRRYRQILSAQPGFKTGSLPAGGMWYAKIQGGHGGHERDGSVPGHHTWQQVPDSYQQWDFPEDIFSHDRSVERQLFTGKVLLKIADFFWELGQEYGMEQRVPIWELVNYTTVRFPWLTRYTAVSVNDNSGSDIMDEQAWEQTVPARSDDLFSNPDELAALALSVKSIMAFAHDFVSKCSHEECTVFLLKARGVKLRVIAERLGLRDTNRVYTLFRSFSRKLSSFMTSWPGPGFDELPEEAKAIFMDGLKRCCKNRLAGP